MRPGLRRRWLILGVLAAATACNPPPQPTASSPPSSESTTSTSISAAPSPDARATLAALRIDDQPHTADYRRDEWPHWRDIDGDGCDARDQALIAASSPPAQTSGKCTVTAGTWHSDYDDKTFTTPGEVDVDHVVPLENAHQSGGWLWSTDQRALYANDQADLWVVSAGSNRSKGSKAPDQWRPPSRAIWCTYATRWVAIKVRWNLTATTAERDALGQMLDTCEPGEATTVPTSSAPPTTTAPASVTTTTAAPSGESTVPKVLVNRGARANPQVTP